MSIPGILVGGVGNIFLGDDAFGVEVARRLTARSLPEDVRVVDFGIRSFDLAFALLDGYELTILVDAASRGGAPGTLYTIDLDVDNPGSEDAPCVDGHRLDVAQVLRMAGQMGGPLGRILLVGCEPATFGAEAEGWMGLSPAVAAAVDRAVGIVAALIAANRTEATPLAGVTA